MESVKKVENPTEKIIIKPYHSYLLFKKRNGYGQTRCHICNQINWDSMCYDVSIFADNTPVQYNHFVVCIECKQYFKGGIKSE